MNENRYQFNKERHLHTLDGKPLTGVTTILGVVSKPALIPWAANMAVDYILSKLLTRGENTAIVPVSAFDEARKAHTKKKEAAGDWGTIVHAWIEKYAKAAIAGNAATASVPLEGKMGEACRHFMKWVSDNKVMFLESEKNVWSEKLWIGGIADLVVGIDGKKWVADVKTGSAIYPEHFWQMSAYDLCLEEMGLQSDIAGHIVLNLKKDGTFDEKRSVSNADNREAFLACLTIYRKREKINNTII